MYLRPRTLGEACTALAEHSAAILSGGTDFFPSLGEGPPPARVVDLSRVADLGGIEVGPDGVRIGARATWTDVLRADLPPAFRALKAAAREVGSVQIQNVATVSGNLCNASPAADGVPPLLILDATVELASASGRRQMPLSDFILGNRRTARRPDEVVSAIQVPAGEADGRSTFMKLGARRYLVISIVSVAVRLVVTEGAVRDAGVAVGSCSAVARRLPALEAALRGRRVADDLADAIAAEHLAPLSPIDDGRATAAFRDAAALELVRRVIVACAGEA